jgi:hypothetical protein
LNEIELELLELAALNAGRHIVEQAIRLRALKEISLCSTEALCAFAAARTVAVREAVWERPRLRPAG